MIPLRTGALDKIACHDAIKHFHRDSDSRFIQEVQRLLRPGGRCAISQIFIGNRYVELTRCFTFGYHFDARSHYVIDPSATVVNCGYVRIYDLNAVADRVLAHIDLTRFRPTLVEFTTGAAPLPDLSLQRTATLLA